MISPPDLIDTASNMAASGASHLGNGKINLGFLRDYYRRELLECLEKCSGTKVNFEIQQLTHFKGHFCEKIQTKSRF